MLQSCYGKIESRTGTEGKYRHHIELIEVLWALLGKKRNTASSSFRDTNRDEGRGRGLGAHRDSSFFLHKDTTPQPGGEGLVALGVVLSYDRGRIIERHKSQWEVLKMS